jgi:hypothetical protein
MNTGIEAPKTYSIIVTERHQASRERRDLLASFGAVQRHANARVVGTSERQCPLHNRAWQKDLISRRKLNSAGTTVVRNSNT